MKRRAFLAGLLASTAAVQLGPLIPAAAEPMVGLDLAAGGDFTALWLVPRGDPALFYVSEAMWNLVCGVMSEERAKMQGFRQYQQIPLVSTPQSIAIEVEEAFTLPIVRKMAERLGRA